VRQEEDASDQDDTDDRKQRGAWERADAAHDRIKRPQLAAVALWLNLP